MRITKKVRKNEKGIALIFSLVIVGLLLVMALSFVSSSIFDQRASNNAANSVVARGLAQSTVTRVLAMMEVYGNVTAYSRIDDGNTDFLSLLSTDGVFAYDPTKNSDITWEMVKSADQGNMRILGRVAYIAVPDRLNNDGSDTVSLDGIGLDPAACVKPGVDEGAFAEERVGASMDEINLRSLNPDVITASLARKLGYTDAGGVLPLPAMGVWVDFATLFRRLGAISDEQKLVLKGNLMIDSPATKELFAMDTDSNKKGDTEELFNRFQLNKTQAAWDNMTVAGLLSVAKSAGDSNPNSGGLAWLRYFGAKWDIASSSFVYDESLKGTFEVVADRRSQIAANLIDYSDSDSVPSSDVAVADWDDIDKEGPGYTGNEKTPYLNEIGCYIQSMVERNDDSNSVKVHVDGFVAPELVNLYGSSFNSPTDVKIWGSYEYTVRFKEKKSAENDDNGDILPPGEDEQPEGEDHPLYNYPAKTFWSIDDENAKVYYYIMSDANPQVKTEGSISGLVSTNGGRSDIESMKINDNGYLYFIDRDRGSKAKLYRIDPNSFDQNSSTPVPATLIGSTGFDSNSSAALTNFEFLADGRVLGIGHYDGRVYTLDLATGKQTLLTKLYLNGSRWYHTVDGLTQAADGTIYFTHTGSYYDNRNSYKYDKETVLYKFTDLENGTMEEVMRIYGSGKVEALAAHPDGNIYCADDYKWYRVNPIAKTTEVVTQFSADIEGMDFHWPSELIKDGNSSQVASTGDSGNESNLPDGRNNPLFSYPVKTFWSIDDESAKMYYYQIDGGNSQVKPEGQITGLVSSSSDIEAMKINDNGYIYFIDERGSSKLYRVDPNVFDGDPSTPVPATYIGDTGHDGSDKLTNMEFLKDGRVIAIGHYDGKLYKLNLETAKTDRIAKLYYKSGSKWKRWEHTVDGLAQAADGTIYFTHTGRYYDNRNSYKQDKETVLYKFVDLAKGRVEKVMNIHGSGKIEAIATHPDGYIYCADDFKWYKVDPKAKTTEVVTLFSADIEGMDFHWPSEVIKEEEGDGGTGGSGNDDGATGEEPGDPTPEPVWQTVTVQGTFYRTINMGNTSWNDKGYKMSWSNASQSFINSSDKVVTFTTHDGYEFAEAEVINVKVNISRAVLEYAGKNVDIALFDADILSTDELVEDLAALDFYSDVKCSGKHNCNCARHRYRHRHGSGDVNDNDDAGYGNTERERHRNRHRKRNGKGACCSTGTLMQLTNAEDSWKKFYMAGSISAIDPRQNLNPGDWLIKSVVVADESTSDLSLNAVKAYELAGGSVAEANYYGNNSSIYKTKFSPYKSYQANATKVDYEKNVDNPVNVSTNRIRNAAMQSPWELGFIHRGAAWQTINLKAFDTAHAVGFKDGTVIGEYAKGDANILDQIKMTDGVESPYKVDLKVANSAILAALLDRIKVNTSGLSDIAGTNSGDLVADLVDVVAAIRADQNLTTRASIVNLTINDKNAFSGSVMATQDNDAAQEEVIGKFINLTGTISPITEEGAASPEYFTLIVVAQSIKDVGGVDGNGIKIKKTFSDRTIAEIDTKLGSFDFATNDVNGGQEYVYADELTAEHKIKLLVKRDLATGKLHIVDTKYVPSNPDDGNSSDSGSSTADTDSSGGGSTVGDDSSGSGSPVVDTPTPSPAEPDFEIIDDVIVANEQVNISIELVGMAYDYGYNDPIPVCAWWSVDGGNSLNEIGDGNLNPQGGYQGETVWDLGVFDAGTEVTLRMQNQDKLDRDRNTWSDSDYIKAQRDGDVVPEISAAFPWQDTLEDFLGDIIDPDTSVLNLPPGDVLIAAEISFLTGSGADWNDAIFIIHVDAI